MALAYHLPIYKASYDMILQLFHVIKKYPKEFKYTLGEQLKKDSLTLISSIYKAHIAVWSISSGRWVVAHDLLLEARWHLESVRVMLRISHDLHVIPVEKFAVLQVSLENISKQLSGWDSSMKRIGH